jgi:hypothetical protein
MPYQRLPMRHGRTYWTRGRRQPLTTPGGRRRTTWTIVQETLRTQQTRSIYRHRTRALRHLRRLSVPACPIRTTTLDGAGEITPGRPRPCRGRTTAPLVAGTIPERSAQCRGRTILVAGEGRIRGRLRRECHRRMTMVHSGTILVPSPSSTLAKLAEACLLCLCLCGCACRAGTASVPRNAVVDVAPYQATGHGRPMALDAGSGEPPWWALGPAASKACEVDPKYLTGFCSRIADRDTADRCSTACMEAYWRALTRPAEPKERTDFARTLLECVARRDTSDGSQGCAFTPPLAPLDLDQVRCNARCDEIAADHRRERLRSLPP